MSTAITGLLRELRHGESELERRLRAVGERHRTEHDIYHVTTDLARWSRQNLTAMTSRNESAASVLSTVRQIAEHSDAMAAVRERTATVLGRRPEPGLLLLRDVRGLFLLASCNSVNWTVLGQAAQATRDSQLLSIVSECHPRTIRQIKWCDASLKETAPQILIAADLG
jgi:hypothetical protein